MSLLLLLFITLRTVRAYGVLRPLYRALAVPQHFLFITNQTAINATTERHIVHKYNSIKCLCVVLLTF